MYRENVTYILLVLVYPALVSWHLPHIDISYAVTSGRSMRTLPLLRGCCRYFRQISVSIMGDIREKLMPGMSRGEGGRTTW